eukprot:CAMPEP_0174748466 /NCGR_PEP_ID=MMETSP1094-20130205/93550_1 /TAXON_ID=156173 /ORGANISM="Chrysochromulina brevifilum, Strain UTEX LB 985" /LENGTH=30 /DNA_ID= /DNA_START= /DNA_END= /DNA_ORIENTATION=
MDVDDGVAWHMGADDDHLMRACEMMRWGRC